MCSITYKKKKSLSIIDRIKSLPRSLGDRDRLFRRRVFAEFDVPPPRYRLPTYRSN